MPLEAKICGLNDPASVDVAAQGGAALCGFVFYPPSPRSVTAEMAAALAARLPQNVIRVGLFVDAGDGEIRAVLAAAPLDLLQLHGAESPARVADIKRFSGLPAMKVVSLAGSEDLARVAQYVGVADRLLFDAKPPPGMKDALPGGNALAFDWKMLKDARIPLPWILAGGLDAGNLARAVELSGADTVDVSSGVEDAPGRKNPDKIQAFLAAAKAI